jgi:hypothetical protein
MGIPTDVAPTKQKGVHLSEDEVVALKMKYPKSSSEVMRNAIKLINDTVIDDVSIDLINSEVADVQKLYELVVDDTNFIISSRKVEVMIGNLERFQEINANLSELLVPRVIPSSLFFGSQAEKVPQSITPKGKKRCWKRLSILKHIFQI